MAHKLDRSLSSLTAIAAASLLLSTTAPALAQTQDAAPTAAAPAATVQPPAAQPETPQAAPPQAAAPEAAPPQAAAPVAPTMTTNPVVQPIPDTSAETAQAPAQTQAAPARTINRPAAQPAPRQATTRLQSTQTAAPAPAAATTPASPAPRVQTTSESASTVTRRDPAGLYNADGSPAATTDTPALAASRQSPYARYWPLEAAGAIVVIGLIGYAFTRRREEDEDVTQPYETLAYEAPPEPVEAAPVMAAPVMETPAPVPTTASVLPAGPVPTGEARAALLEKMVAAPPDDANPFTTAKARMRRARMILNTRNQAIRDSATETFDWRTYKPSLRHPTLGEPVVKPNRETIK